MQCFRRSGFPVKKPIKRKAYKMIHDTDSEPGTGKKH